MKKLVALVFVLTVFNHCYSQSDSSEKWTYHFQFTGIMQGHPKFNAPYSGQNSLNDTAEHAFSVTSTIYLGRKLWKGSAVYFNPEVAGGKGISSALGIAGFTNGECFRIGDPSPALYIGRAFIRQHIKLGKCDYDTADAGFNQLGKELIPQSRITITAGKFCIADVYDLNNYSHDPRMQFMNWALMNNGAWDYPANTRGYTSGIIIEIVKPKWVLRLSETLVPQKANGSVMDVNISKARGETIEFEKKLKIKGHAGSIRLLAFHNLSHAGNYEQSIANFLNATDYSLNVNTLTTYGGMKYGFGFNADQEITSDLGIFARASWNDGHTATWVFTEIDQTGSIGLSLKGTKWKRKNDVVGLAGVWNGISNEHWDFLNFGGYGFIIGDGKLPHYGLETIGEFFYNCQIAKTLWLTADYQYVMNPAYNRDRGPVNVWGVRAHVQF